MSVVLLDQFQRPLRNLRLSVTDRCNLRCSYCMPEPEYVWLPREDILQFEEIERLVDTFLDLGVDKVRLTGGEPLLRRDLPTLIESLAARSRIRDLAMTTNGILLAEHVPALADAGLHRLTVSLDTLHPDRFLHLTRSSELHRVLEGIAAAAPRFPGLKIDSVVMRGTNEDELSDLIEFARTYGAEVRFIEYMDVGGATHWSMDRVVSRTEMLASLAQRYGDIQAVEETSSAPADRYRLPDGTIFGIISSTTEPFCETCDRSRLTADGMWYLCLYASRGLDLRGALRAGIDPAEHRGIDPNGVGRTSRSRRRGPACRERSFAAHSNRHAASRSASRDAHARRVIRLAAHARALLFYVVSGFSRTNSGVAVFAGPAKAGHYVHEQSALAANTALFDARPDLLESAVPPAPIAVEAILRGVLLVVVLVILLRPVEGRGRRHRDDDRLAAEPLLHFRLRRLCGRPLCLGVKEDHGTIAVTRVAELPVGNKRIHVVPVVLEQRVVAHDSWVEHHVDRLGVSGSSPCDLPIRRIRHGSTRVAGGR